MTFKNILQKEKEPQECRVVTPAVNIHEQEHDIMLDAEMPGLEKEDIQLEVEGDELIISGKRHSSVPEGYSAVYQERMPVEYKRVFSLSSEIDRTNVSAKYANGILSIVLTKSEEAKPKKIAVM